MKILFVIGSYSLFGLALYFGFNSSFTKSTEIHCQHGSVEACAYLLEEG